MLGMDQNYCSNCGARCRVGNIRQYDIEPRLALMREMGDLLKVMNFAWEEAELLYPLRDSMKQILARYEYQQAAALQLHCPHGKGERQIE